MKYSRKVDRTVSMALGLVTNVLSMGNTAIVYQMSTEIFIKRQRYRNEPENKINGKQTAAPANENKRNTRGW